ncbi:MAG: FKBP-type peptidyl-prolyl cis-trans isomerase [Bacteroidales bacterium]|nr:FKBP-type peptidyl-prolyl cis-trans isomerase [Bacteroidales bacterium]
MDKTSYALGMSIANNLLSSGVSDLVFEDFAAGLKAVLSGGKTAISIEEAGDILGKFFQKLEDEKAAEQAAIGDAFKKEGEEWLAANAKAPGVKVLPSGLQYRVLKQGFGKKPGPTSRVRCHCEGTFTDGTVFDSSYKRGEPAVFGLNQVIRGWTEGLQLMAEGSVYELFIPYQLAYGEAGAHGAIPPCAALRFKVELIAVL